ncbi:hypothetical protein ACFL1H_00210 [Nanoarchaeota archaeon]
MKRGFVNIAVNRLILSLILLVLGFFFVSLIIQNIIQHEDVSFERASKFTFNRIYEELNRLEPEETVELPLYTYGSDAIMLFLVTEEKGKPKICGNQACICIFALKVYNEDCDNTGECKCEPFEDIDFDIVGSDDTILTLNTGLRQNLKVRRNLDNKVTVELVVVT